MTRTAQPSIRKRFPGQHCFRFKLWTVKGSRVEMEGRIDGELAILFVAAASRKLTLAQRQELVSLTKRLKQEKAR